MQPSIRAPSCLAPRPYLALLDIQQHIDGALVQDTGQGLLKSAANEGDHTREARQALSFQAPTHAVAHLQWSATQARVRTKREGPNPNAKKRRGLMQISGSPRSVCAYDIRGSNNTSGNREWP